MDTREARRAAEKAARDLMQQRTDFVGTLAVAHAERNRCTDALTRAHSEGEAIIAAARAQAARLVEEASTAITAADEAYNTARTAALEAGWRSAELDQLGFRPLGRKRTRTTAHRTDAPVGAHDGDQLAS